jgi:predicted ABC-type ATPase
MVAGPNGSGKSTLFDELKARGFRLGHVLNPDEIERQLVHDRKLDLKQWGLQADEVTVGAFFARHALAAKLSNDVFSVEDNVISIGANFVPGYFTAVLSDLMRRQWLATGQSFTFETVMSSGDKVELLDEARARGFRTYLYYVCTDSPLINRERVAIRVAQGGHDVPEVKIDARYRRSVALLPNAIRRTSRAYVFDNSGRAHRLVGEFEAGKLVAVAEELPGWFASAVLSQADIAG